MTLLQWQARQWVLRFDELTHYLATKDGIPNNPSMKPKDRTWLDELMLDWPQASPR